MIKVVFKKAKNQDMYQTFTLTGHAESGDYGHDLVCSAVSALAISTVNSLEALTQTHYQVDVDQEKGGFLSVKLFPSENSTDHDSQLLIKHLLLALKSIEDQYQMNIQVIEQ